MQGQRQRVEMVKDFQVTELVQHQTSCRKPLFLSSDIEKHGIQMNTFQKAVMHLGTVVQACNPSC